MKLRKIGLRIDFGPIEMLLIRFVRIRLVARLLVHSSIETFRRAQRCR